MPALKKNNQRLKTASLIIFLSCLCITAQAKNINISSTKAYKENNTYYLDASVNIKLTEEVRKALRHGIAIQIHTQFQLYLIRDWLWDKKIEELTIMHRLEHQPLTNKYLTVNLKTGLRRSYDSLENALDYISSISRLALFNKNTIEQDEHYMGRLRSYLDLESLPTPMRAQAYFSSSWDISSDWFEWQIER